MPATGSTGFGVSDYAGFLKNQQTVRWIYDQVNRAMDFVSMFMAPEQDIFGTGLRVPIITRGPRKSVGFRAERNPMPDAEAVTSVLGIASMKRIYGYHDVTEEQMGASMSPEGAWESIQSTQLFTLAQESGDYLNQAGFRDGSGRLAKITAVVAQAANSGTYDVIDAGGINYAPPGQDDDGAKFLEKNDILAAAIPGASPTFRVGTWRVTSITRDTTPNRITVDASDGAATPALVVGDYFVRAGTFNSLLAAGSVGQHTGVGAGTDFGVGLDGAGVSRFGGKESEGLHRWFNDVGPTEWATTMGSPLAIPTGGKWSGFQINFAGSPKEFTLQDHYRLTSTVGRRRGRRCDQIWSSIGIYDFIALTYFVPDQRQNDTIRAEHVGFAPGSLKIGGLSINASKDCPPGTYWAFCGEDIIGAQQGPPHWAGSPGNILHYVPSTGTQYEAVLVIPFNMIAWRRNAGGFIRGVKEVIPIKQGNN